MCRPSTMMAALTLVLTACSSGTEDAVPLTTVVTATSTISTTSGTMTSTTTMSTTTTSPAPATFDVEPGAPIAELTSFLATVSIDVTLGDLVVGLNSEGKYLTTAYECQSAVALVGLSFSSKVIATPENVWIDRRQGFELTSLFDDDVQTAIGVCPANPTFWLDFEPLPAVDGDSDTFYNMLTQRIQLTDLSGLGSYLGFDFENTEDRESNEMIVWIADPGWMAGFDLSVRFDSLSAPKIFDLPVDPGGPTSGELNLSLRVFDPNDPSIEIVLPTERMNREVHVS